MRTNFALAATAVSAIAGVATAGTVTVGLAPAANTADVQLTEFNSAFASTPSAQSSITGFASAVSGFDLAFGSIATGEARAASGNFFVGTGAALNGSGTGNWFSNVAGGAAALSGDTVMAFGNSGFSARSVTIDFQPGVAGFIFNFTDIGDVSNAELVVTWSDGSVTSPAIGNNGQLTGYISLLAGAGQTIESVTLSQDPVANDGFLFYGFTTLTVVPLPPAAWAGLAMLGGVAGVRKLRRRG